MHQVIGNIQGREITLETGSLAKQANGAVVLRCGETVLLATATMAKEPREGADFSHSLLNLLRNIMQLVSLPAATSSVKHVHLKMRLSFLV